MDVHIGRPEYGPITAGTMRKNKGTKRWCHIHAAKDKNEYCQFGSTRHKQAMVVIARAGAGDATNTANTAPSYRV